MFLIYPIGGGDGTSACLYFMVYVLDVSYPSPFVSGLFIFTMNLPKTENSYFEVHTQLRDIQVKP